MKGTTIFATGDGRGQVVLRWVPFGRQILRVSVVGFLAQDVEVDVRRDTLRLAPVVLRRCSRGASQCVVLF